MNRYPTLNRIVLVVALGFIFVLNAQAQFSQEQQFNNLGSVVSISGDRIVVGDSGDDDNGSNAGAAYVFERQANGIWQEIVKLTASDASAEDRFGSRVALNGDRFVIGASGNDDDGDNSGAAYVFERQVNGDWQEVAKLTAFDAAASDNFGSSVSISGDRIVVGASGDDDNGFSSGAVYVFIREGDGSWSSGPKLIASDGTERDGFGTGVSISGDRIVVGAPEFTSFILGAFPGAVYVFERQADDTWQEVSKLTASDARRTDRFGTELSLMEDRLVIGAPGVVDVGTTGAAYVFERQANGAWQEVAILTAADGELRDLFGHSVSLNGDRIVSGAPGDDDDGAFSGSAYVFERQTNGSWQETAKLTASDGAALARFGNSVSLSSSRVAVGASIGSNSSAVYIFASSTMPPTTSCDCANATIAGTSGNDKLVGTPGDDTICGFGGDDRLFGEGGNDCLDGGSGHDRLFGGPGNDRLFGRLGNDRLQGEDGDDVLNGNGDDDVLQGGDGDDILQGAGGDDVLRGDAGADDLSGGSGDDNMRGGSENDVMRGGSGDDILRGNDGDDDLRGDAGQDVMMGASGNDHLRGGPNNDIIRGDDGNDTLEGNGGDDMIRGGRGDDDLRGGPGADELNGNQGADVLRGGSGNDIVRGSSGDDELNGNQGDDFLQGDGGSNIFQGGAGVDLCKGGSGFDIETDCEETIRIP